jgi:hypothetical protein
MSKSIDIKDLIERDGLWYEKFTNEPFTGKTTGRQQFNYKDGKVEGEYLEYYKSGQLYLKNNYKNDKKEGQELWYHENGQLLLNSFDFGFSETKYSHFLQFKVSTRTNKLVYSQTDKYTPPPTQT